MSDKRQPSSSAAPQRPGGIGQGHGPGHGGGPPHARMIEKPKNAKRALSRLTRYLARNLWLMCFIFGLSIVSALVNIIGTRLSGTVVDDFIATKDVSGLLTLCVTLLVIYLFGVVAAYAQGRLAVRLSQTTTATLRQDLFVHLGKLPLSYFDTHSSGDLMSRLTNDVDTIGMTISQNVAQLFSGVVSIVGVLIAMLLLSPSLTLVAVAVVPVMLVVTRSIARFTRKLFKRQSAQLGMLNGYIEEIVSGQKVVKLYNREARVEQEFEALNQQLRRSGTLANGVSGLMGPVMNMINNISYLIVAAYGGTLVISGRVSVGDVFAFLQYLRQFSNPVNQIANLFNTIQSALAAAERVFEIMDVAPERDAEGAIELTNPRGEIAFDDVTFSYISGTPVLKNAYIHATPGEQVAIVGRTGAGKTTIISLLTRFYDVDSGAIRIDGHDIRTLTLASLRRAVGMVLQDTYLFSETVRDNIRYGRPDASDEDVERAARMANAHGFIAQLPKGYDTILADNGGNLSQGQRQLLAIARAILADPQVLILDEATSSVDTRTELNIQDALLQLMKDRTSFVIAHRLSTIRAADNILVIDAGEVVESGTHDALMVKEDGYYADLYNMQFASGLAI